MAKDSNLIFDGYCCPGTERDTHLPVADLVRQMDESGIGKAIIASEDRELAVRNVEGNDRILKVAAEFPDRLIPACGINPWYGSDAVCELERSVNGGARMLVLAPALQGFIPTDEVADALLDKAAKLKILVYIHTGPHSSGGPTQVALVAERHAGTNFIMGHCGSTDHAWDMPSLLEFHHLDNLWFELSFVRPWAVSRYVKLGGSSRFIWASGSPQNSPQFELQQLNQHLPMHEYPDVYGQNLARLVGE